MTIFMLHAGERYNTSTLIKHVGGSPEVAIDATELNDGKVSFTAGNSTVSEPECHHIVVFKVDGKFVVLLGKAKLAELRAKGQAKVKTRLITKHVLKHCLPAPVIADPQRVQDNRDYPASDRYNDRRPVGGGYSAPRYGQNTRNWS